MEVAAKTHCKVMWIQGKELWLFLQSTMEMFLIFNIWLLETSEKNCIDCEANMESCMTLWVFLSLVHLGEIYVEPQAFWDLNEPAQCSEERPEKVGLF